MTRWHNGDLVGRLLRDVDSGDKWDVVNFPAISEEGEALWPEWYPVEELTKIKKVIGSRDFSALYQQDPSGDDVAGFQDSWLSYWDATRLDNMAIYIICDPASEKKKDSDYTVFMVVGVGYDGNYYIIDMVRDRLSLTEKAKTLFALHRQYDPVDVGYEKYGMQSDIEHFKSKMDDLNYRFNITELGGAMPKNDRIRRLVPLFEEGRIFLPETCVKVDYQGNKVNLVNSFINDEYKEFPVSTHDDMLDCLARIRHPDFILNVKSRLEPMVVKSQSEKDWENVLGLGESEAAFCLA
jgi:predicted phage terminase large subunit-like protein